MEFFESLIEKTYCIFKGKKETVYPFDLNKSWKNMDYSQVILQRDTAFELNGTGFSLTTSKDIGYKIVVIGKELSEIKGDSKFARIAFVSVDSWGEGQEVYDLIKKIEYVKYHLFPEGYMIRSSSSSYKEGVRVGKKALKSGVSFEKIGNLMIEQYRSIPGVKGATVYFITDDSIDYSEIKSIAEKNREVTEALNQVMNNLEFDCKSCNLKPICDEVEGMRELHFSKKGKM